MFSLKLINDTNRKHKQMKQNIYFIIFIYKQKAYKDEWEQDKQMIYYPAHLTPNYEASAKIKQVQADVSLNL